MSDDSPHRYVIQLSEVAEADIDSHTFYLLGRSPDIAGRWAHDLQSGLDSLEVFPRRCPVAPEHSAFGYEVRQLLFGSGRGMVRVFFVVRDEPSDEPPVVHVLRLIHASRSLAADNDDS
jgi:plasmid stabilization system protein ParE